MKDNPINDDLFRGLSALAESAFPKQCANCGRRFESAEQFLRETENLHSTQTGLKQSCDDDGSLIVEVFRNCPCGSTLMDIFNNRRDVSEAGRIRREKFSKLIDFLVERGVDTKTARNELLKILHGEKSELLAGIRPPEESIE